MTSFSKLNLSNELIKVLNDIGFDKPTHIQQKAIPLLNKKPIDFIGLAQTGTGKTAAFGLPLIDFINSKNKETQALVLAPTRELGQQIANQLSLFSKYLPNIQIQAVYGGASITVQMKEIKRKTPHIVIATPGRLLDLMRRKTLSLDSIKFVILDEADEMLNMGFKEDLDKILSYTGDDKNTWLFSATMPNDIRLIIKNYMSNPVEVKVSSENQINENIIHQYVIVNSSTKFDGLKRILDLDEDFRGIIFCRTRAATQQLADNLKKTGYHVDALHGEMSQSQRDRVMKRFKEHSLKILVATDVAARGIDVNDLTHVVHYSLPDDDAYYTHRSGRTARAGKKGISLCVLTNRDISKFNFLEKRLKLKMTKINLPSEKDVANKRLTKWADKILNTTKSKHIDGKILTDVQMLLGKLTYEELVEKLVSIQLENLNYKKTKVISSNEQSSKRKNIKDKSDRKSKIKKDRKSDKKSNFNGVRFFINVGKMDDVSKRDLVDFISDTAKIKKQDIGALDIQKSFSFFEVNKKYSKNISNSFNGIYIDGRELRVNRDSKK